MPFQRKDATTHLFLCPKLTGCTSKCIINNLRYPLENILKLRKLSQLSLAIVAALTTSVNAEETKTTAKQDAFEKIEVTARKRTENVKDVPIAISALTPKKLEVLGSSGMDVRALSGKLPSLLIESSFGRTFPRFYIRGLGNTDFDLLASQPVSTPTGGDCHVISLL